MATILSDKLRLLREEQGLKQSVLADELGCTRYMISYYENGRAPSYDMLVAYCKRFDVSSDYLLGLSNERKPMGGKLMPILSSLAAYDSVHAPTATDFVAILTSAVRYYQKGAPSGDIPLRALKGFMEGLSRAMDAAVSSDIPALLDAANSAAVSALDIAKMPASLYENKEDPAL